MTEQRTNRLTAAASQDSGKLAIGTPQALTQLYDHCARLNAFRWVVASGRPYLVRQNREKGWHEIVRTGDVIDEPSPLARAA